MLGKGRKEIMTEKPLSKFKQRTIEGKCGHCGEWAYPYTLCKHCRYAANIRRCLNNFVKRGWCDISRNPKDNKKLYKWNNTAPEQISRNYTPESIAKMSLPRLNGKPITEKVIGDAILKILEANGCPLTEKEIEKGFRSLKNSNKIIPEKESLISEYRLIQSKQSNLSRSQREAVNTRIKFLLERGVITNEQLYA